MTGKIACSKIKVQYQDERHIFEFIPSDTVGKLIGEVEEITGSSCIIKDMGL